MGDLTYASPGQIKPPPLPSSFGGGGYLCEANPKPQTLNCKIVGVKPMHLNY